MLWLIRYIKGFLKISISGEYKETFINKAMKSGVFLWDLCVLEDEITAHIGIKDFKYLPLMRRKAKAHIKIDKKYGLPFFTYRYRKRAGFILGAVLFFSILQFLSLFVWSVQVSGNTTVKSEEILSCCRKVGVFEGVRKSKISSKNAAGRILLLNDKLAWCSVNVEGSIVTVNVTETKNMPSEKDGKPSNLVAAEDGIITKIDVKSGNTAVKVGDAVAKGDILVSGIIESMSSTAFVRSSGIVEAKIQKTFTKKADFRIIQNMPTNKTKKHVTLEAFSLKIPFYFTKTKGDYITENSNKRLIINGKALPFGVSVEKFIFTEKKKINRSEKELKTLLKKEITKEIKAFTNEKYEIIAEDYIATKEGIELKVTIETVCDITAEKQISVIKN